MNTFSRFYISLDKNEQETQVPKKDAESVSGNLVAGNKEN